MKSILLITALTLVLAGCKKDVEELQPQTQTGANTFGAKVNGVNWEPRGFGIVPTAEILEGDIIQNSIRVIARNFASSPTETEMEIFLKDITTPGTYNLNQSTANYPNATASYARFLERRITPKYEWVTDESHTGTVTITRVDQAAKIISGTFSFTGKDKYGDADPVVVTEGRFDVKY